MFKKSYPNFLFVMFLTVLPLQRIYALDDPPTNSSDDQDQTSFPFDKQCLTFDKSNFKVGQALLDVMTTGDFPQYCVLYSLSKYQIAQKKEDGYFITGSGLDSTHADASKVFLKSNKAYQQNQALASLGLGDSKPVGQWAYFVATERFVIANGEEKEFYVFQEIDF